VLQGYSFVLNAVKTRSQTEDENIWTVWKAGYSITELKSFQENDEDIGPLLQYLAQGPHFKYSKWSVSGQSHSRGFKHLDIASALPCLDPGLYSTVKSKTPIKTPRKKTLGRRQ
jgi:hypothetical protein